MMVTSYSLQKYDIILLYIWGTSNFQTKQDKFSPDKLFDLNIVAHIENKNILEMQCFRTDFKFFV